jgi:imidazolonepropionase
LSKILAEIASRDQWTLIRRAGQLLTLHGATGPRRGPALRELGVIEDGALLIHNGIIRQSGPSRRVENLARSRQAFEIDLGGRIVLPAFVDPDAVLVLPPRPARRWPDHRGIAGQAPPREIALRVLSLRRLQIAAAAAASALVRLGTLSAGAHTGYAADLRDTVKVLRIHQALQGKPLRVRSVLSPPLTNGALPENLAEKWLPAIRQRKLSAMLELAGELNLDQIRPLATVAAALGYSTRLRAKGPPDAHLLEFAAEAGTVSIIAPAGYECPRQLADMGCVHVIPVSEAVREDLNLRAYVRQAVDAGTPIALSSGHSTNRSEAFNPQFLLHLACAGLGLTCEEAIVAATYNAACALRMSHVTGSLEPGKSADLAVMDVPDYRELTRRAGHNDVELVIRAGLPVYRRASLIPD